MQESIKKIASLFWVILVMLSSTSFIIKKHECLKMAKHEKVKLLKRCCTTDEDKCCTSNVIFQKDASSVDFISTVISFSLTKDLFIQDNVFSFSFREILIETLHKNKFNYIDFYPPDLLQKFYILHETFLI